MRLEARNGGSAGRRGAGRRGVQRSVEWARARDTWASRNGFKIVARDTEGVGYLVLDRFVDTPEAQATAVAAMRFLAGTARIELDLRYVEGGDAAMAARLTSLLFDTEALDGAETLATQGHLPAIRSEDRCLTQSIEVLVTRDSHFLALAFALNLVHLGRATARIKPVAAARCCA